MHDSRCIGLESFVCSLAPLFPTMWPNILIGSGHSTHFQKKRKLPPMFEPSQLLEASSISTTLFSQKIDFSNTPISAIFVYHDPRNWALDSWFFLYLSFIPCMMNADNSSSNVRRYSVRRDHRRPIYTTG